ncbi:MAG: hypothetical protein HYV97_04525 [Bdellovibrio sp.]|nr:hypothetical protein [Bdellovibrio sp.]
MKGIILFFMFASAVWADQATYDARLETISAIANAKRCYTLQNSGLTSVEFARLRAICWKAQLGDAWAARNPVYSSKTLSKLERPLTAEEKAAEKAAAEAAAEKVRKDQEAATALAAQKRACLDIGILTVRWDSDSKSCQCLQQNYTLRNGQCLSPLAIELERQGKICQDAGADVERLPDPDHPGVEIICRSPATPRTLQTLRSICRPRMHSMGTIDFTAFGLPPQSEDSHCVLDHTRGLLEQFGLDNNNHGPAMHPALSNYFDSIDL